MRLLQKGRRKMLLRPNSPAACRNWAYCCAAIDKLEKEFNYCAAFKGDMKDYFYIKANGMEAFKNLCRKKCQRISRKITLYRKLRDRIAAMPDAPERRLLQVEDMLNMIGNVIDVTPRHSKKQVFRALNECSDDGTLINDMDAYMLLSFGYGR